MKKTTIFLLAVIAAVCAWAETETVDGYTWSYRIKDGTAEIYKADDRWPIGTTAISPKPTGAIAIPSVLGGKPVTSIGYQALASCYDLTSVKIPAKVTYIGENAFACCINLKSFDVAAGNPSYKSVSGLLLSKDGKTLVAGVNGVVSIPDGVENIGENAFYSYKLTSVTMPNSVRNIGNGAFIYCSHSTSVTIPNSVTNIGNHAFHGCLDLPSVSIPNSVRSIGSSAFLQCWKLTSVTIPKTVTSIRESMRAREFPVQHGDFRDSA